MKKFILLIATLIVAGCCYAGYVISRAADSVVFNSDGANEGNISINIAPLSYTSSADEEAEEIVVDNSASPKSEVRQLAPFHTIYSNSAIRVEYVTGSNYSARVEADSRIIKKVKTEVRGGVLYIGYNGRVTIRGDRPTTIYLTGKNLSEVNASSSSQMNLNLSESGVAREFSINATSGADIIFNSLSSSEVEIEATSVATVTGAINRAAEVDVELSSSAKVTLSGHCQHLSVDSSSSADADLKELEAVDVEADASSASKITVTASHRLEAEASSAANIRYRGPNGLITEIEESSAGTVRRIR